MTANPLPPLTPEEYEQLKADIALRGVIVPILLDAHGNVIDGHHRRQIARELGEHIICPEETLDCSEEEARDLAVVLNTHRRQLSRDQRREAVAQLVKLGPAVHLIGARRNAGLSQRAAAEAIGVSRDVLLRAESGEGIRPRHAKLIADFYGVLVTDIWPVEREAA